VDLQPFGWMMSGLVVQEGTLINFITIHSTHSLRVDTEPESLENGLRRFWELESLETISYVRFTQQISFKQERCEVHLPWNESHLRLPDNYELCCKQLNRFLKRLKRNPELLLQYATIIRTNFVKGWWKLSHILTIARMETSHTIQLSDMTNRPLS